MMGGPATRYLPSVQPAHCSSGDWLYAFTSGSLVSSLPTPLPHVSQESHIGGRLGYRKPFRMESPDTPLTQREGMAQEAP